MLYTIQPDAMKRVERRMMDETHTPSLLLMERAATHLANSCEAFLETGGCLLTVCGAGNNGGDGLAATRLLLTRHEELRAVIWQLPGQPSSETQTQWTLLKPLQSRLTVVELTDEPPVLPRRTACILDAMFGTGLSRPLSGAALAAAEALNASRCPVVAVDIPSGLDGLTGLLPADEAGAATTAVHATVTVTFHRPKDGLFLREGLNFCGKVRVGDIGIGAEWDDVPGFAVLEHGDTLLPPRPRTAHKGSFGRVLALTGTFGMAGAASLCANAALRTGAGLVTVACPREIVPTVQTLCPCATCLPLSGTAEEAWQTLLPALQSADALAVGCGLGQRPETACLLARLFGWLAESQLPTVLDADALNLLAAASAQGTPIRFPETVVLTPHPAEAARLLGVPTASIVADPPAAARALHACYGGSIVLKGAASVLIAPDGEGLNVLGTPAMAKGGSGDVLTGVLAALLAGRKTYGLQGLRLLQTACALHGLAGLRAEKQISRHGTLASDLCAAVGKVKRLDVGPMRVALWDGKVRGQYPAETGEEAGSCDAGLAGEIMEPTAPYVPGASRTAKAASVPSAPAPEAPASRCGDASPVPEVAAPSFPASPISRAASPLGRQVRVTVDHPLGSPHPEHREILFGLNYGYVAQVLDEDNEWQDAYVVGPKEPVELFEGEVVAVIHSLAGDETRWVVAESGTRLTEAEVRRLTDFAEQFASTRVECL